MIERIRITAITHDGKYMSWETTPIQIEEASGDLLKWIYESMVEEEQRQREEKRTTPLQKVE